MSKEILIPELRFPEFKNEGEWELTTIGDIGKFYYGKSAPKWSLSDDAPTPCVRYGELYTKFGTIITEIKSHTNIEPGDLRFSKGGEILVPRVGEVATDFAKKCCYLPFPNIAIGEMISVFETNEFPIFYTYYFRTLWREFAQVVEGQNVKNLYYVNLEPIKIAKTSFKEQQKIASCLSSLDDLIVAHSQKLELLKDHKKGLMQNLFPQEGETVPKYRFPEFENDGEWLKNTLDEVAIFLKGKGISKADIIEGGKLPCIRYGELYTYYGETINEVKSYTNSNVIDLVLSEANDVIIPASGETQIDIATASCVLESGIALGGDLNIIRSKINGVFLSYYLNNAKKSDIAQMAQGIAVVHLYSSQLKTLQIQIPTNREQQKIASCLSSLDELITAQIERIEQLVLHKKGLMQYMFPRIND